MYKTFNFLFVFFLSTLFFISCEKEPILEVSQSSLTFTEQGGTQTISFSTNKDWTASVSGGAGWCTISHSSGKSEITSITVTVVANTTYDNRAAAITIKAKELSKVITISQPKINAIILTNDSCEVGSIGGNISVKLNSNVEYDVTIPTENQSWITNTTTKGLSTSTLTFAIAPNNIYEKRQGKIIIKDKSSKLSDTAFVTQSQKDAIILSQKEYNLSNSIHTLEVKLRTNVDVEVFVSETGKDWISHVETKALEYKTIVIAVGANEGNEARECEIYLKNLNSSLLETILIKQSALMDIVISLNNAGTIMNYISAYDINHIGSLSVSGEINGTDILLIRRMKNLQVLDLENAKIVAGGNAYYGSYYTENDIIGYNMFYELISLKSFKSPKSCKAIYPRAFQHCYVLEKIELSANLALIGDYAFSGCSKLNKIELPKTLTYLGNQTFKVCSFTEIKIPTALRDLGYLAFNGCSDLRKIIIESSNPPSGLPLFYGENNPLYESLTIYVPKGSYQSYFLTAWGNFKNIVEY